MRKPKPNPSFSALTRGSVSSLSVSSTRTFVYVQPTVADVARGRTARERTFKITS
jgi:hypothetical protein